MGAVDDGEAIEGGDRSAEDGATEDGAAQDSTAEDGAAEDGEPGEPGARHLPTARRPALARVLARATAVLAGLLFVELCAYGLYWARNGAPMSVGDLDTARERLVEGERVEGNLPEADPQDTHDAWVTHPYVGYVLDPDRETYMNRDAVFVHGTDEIPPARREDRVIVGLFGGSVAFQLGGDNTHSLLEALGRAYPGREIVLVMPATPSWKQPQQLFSLQWLALRGYAFDVILELDGFNECLGAAANHSYFHINAAYPPNYRAFVASKAEGPEYLAAAGELVVLDRTRRERAGWLVGSPLRLSPSVNLVWSTWDQGAQVRMDELRDALVHLSSPESHRYGQRGPVDELGDTEEDRGPLYEELGRIWLESNLHMARLARSMGSDFVVFLQPNQHLEGTKPFSEIEEREMRGSEIFGPHTRACYPFLLERGPRLEAEGVAFEDLTRIFSETEETVYADPCCHFNEDGYRLLSNAIAERLSARMAARQRSDAVVAPHPIE